MARAPIPNDVKRFILIGIPSVPYLEALLLLREDGSQSWDCRTVAQRLYISDKAAQAVLDELVSTGVLIRDAQEPATYRYHPQSDDLRQIINRLAAIYATNLVDVTNLIHSKINKKAQQFADAFIWRKDM